MFKRVKILRIETHIITSNILSKLLWLNLIVIFLFFLLILTPIYLLIFLSIKFVKIWTRADEIFILY